MTADEMIEEIDGSHEGEYVVCVYTENGFERVMSVAHNQEESAVIADHLRNGGYMGVTIRRIK